MQGHPHTAYLECLTKELEAETEGLDTEKKNDLRIHTLHRTRLDRVMGHANMQIPKATGADMAKKKVPLACLWPGRVQAGTVARLWM
ncbi:hypothetical protein EBZ38_14675 [bacterium]|nr:hypothetical protein [bacterium]NDC95886.1 hypothetical protein [bacterium]NDD85503.1 hypothetical protein [bacterium]NDG19808.1 hypothetical protein [Betaproteobacteria bacterium]